MSAGPHTPLPVETSRRSFLFALGVALNAFAAVLFAIPVVGYLLSPIRRFTWLAWICIFTSANAIFDQHRKAARSALGL